MICCCLGRAMQTITQQLGPQCVQFVITWCTNTVIYNRSTTDETSRVSNSWSTTFRIYNAITHNHLWAPFCSTSRCSNLCNLHRKRNDWDSVMANSNLVAISTKFEHVGTPFTLTFTETFTYLHGPFTFTCFSKPHFLASRLASRNLHGPSRLPAFWKRH